MSKVDAQRAMRDARYAAYQARRESEAEAVPPVKAPAAAQAAQAAAAAPAVVRPSAPAVEQSTPQPEAGEALCGHRSIGNKSCRRPAGHPETSHRYS